MTQAVPETAFSAALKAAGVDTEAAALRTLAEAHLRRTGINPRAAVGSFVEECRAAGGVLAKLVPYAICRDHALAYLEATAADMRGVALVSAKADDGVRGISESRPNHGPVESSEGGGAASPLDSRSLDGSSSSDPSRKGGDAVRSADDGLVASGRVVSLPRPARGLEALRAHARLNTLFDTFRTRGGPVGDLVMSALPRLRSENAREAALLKLIYDHAQPADPNARVRDVIKLEDLQRMIQKAAEITSD